MLFFNQLTKKKRYNFDSFTPDSYCVGCSFFFFLQLKEKYVSAPDQVGITSLKNLVAHQLKIADDSNYYK